MVVLSKTSKLFANSHVLICLFLVFIFAIHNYQTIMQSCKQIYTRFFQMSSSSCDNSEDVFKFLFCYCQCVSCAKSRKVFNDVQHYKIIKYAKTCRGFNASNTLAVTKVITRTLGHLEKLV
jgi:hypothetical protein